MAPIYEYACANGHTMDILLSSPDELASRDKDRKCKECGGRSRKMMSMPQKMGRMAEPGDEGWSIKNNVTGQTKIIPFNEGITKKMKGKIQVPTS